MNIKLFILFLILFQFKARAQSLAYQPLPEDSLVWASGSFIGLQSDYFKTTFWGDTTINNVDYTKVHQLHAEIGPDLYRTGVGPYLGGFRQDTLLEKMYFIDSLNTEYDISIDHSISIGEKMIVPEHYKDLFGVRTDLLDSIVTTSIDSILIYGHKWRYYNLELYHPLGVLKGRYRAGYGFHSISPLFGDPSMWHLFVYCWTWPTIPQIFPVAETNTFYDLCMIGFLDTIPKQIVVFPNPANTFIQIKGKDLINFSNLKLFDSSGRKVREMAIETEYVSVEIANLANGIYLIHLTSQSDSWIRKVMIY